jgi:DNA-binding transcriptional LysR family regulator
MKLSGFDLNHVRALHFLLEEAHVARAARRLAITPAPASNALLRLRREFEDPLLVRVGRGFVRTPLAEDLRGPARDVLAAAERLVSAAVPFDPATDEGTFVVLATDRVADVLTGPLDRALTARARTRSSTCGRSEAPPPAWTTRVC